MILRIALLAATVLVALTAANAVRHLVEWPTRRDVSAVPIVRVQRTMRRYGLLLDTIETGALVALLIALFRVPPGSAEMWLLGLAAFCVAGMIGIWAAWLRPLNITIAKRLPEALPPDWSHHHRSQLIRSWYHRMQAASEWRRSSRGASGSRSSCCTSDARAERKPRSHTSLA